MLVKKCMKRNCTLSQPFHQTLKTLYDSPPPPFFLLVLCFSWKVTKEVIFSHHFSTAGLSAAAVHRAQARRIQCTYFQRNIHVQVEIKAPFLMHLPLGFFLLLLILHRCDSLNRIHSWISHHQESDDYMFSPSFL